MIEKYRELLLDFELEKINKDEFNKKFPYNLHEDDVYINLLEDCMNIQDGSIVESVLYLGFIYKLYSIECINILCDLIKCKWHTRHEDIMSKFQKLKSPESVDTIVEVINMHFDHFEYNDGYSFKVKCAWALGAINNEDSIQKLHELSQSEDKIIREAAQFQLDRRK